jgi:hypothetical protein
MERARILLMVGSWLLEGRHSEFEAFSHSIINYCKMNSGGVILKEVVRHLGVRKGSE